MPKIEPIKPVKAVNETTSFVGTIVRVMISLNEDYEIFKTFMIVGLVLIALGIFMALWSRCFTSTERRKAEILVKSKILADSILGTNKSPKNKKLM